MNSNVTREAVEILADEKGLTVLSMLTELQAAAAKLGDETTLDALCAIKNEVIEEVRR